MLFRKLDDFFKHHGLSPPGFSKVALEQCSFLHGVADICEVPVIKLPLGEVLLGLVDMVEDVELLRFGVPHYVFAASQAVIEQDEELGPRSASAFNCFMDVILVGIGTTSLRV
jgi:hypothetical protein